MITNKNNKTMKKRILFLALLAITFGASAQTMKVQSAYADWQNNRLRNAMTNIDEACAHEKTSLEAKTWYYAGAIYARVVEISQSDNKEDQKIMKKQKINEPIVEIAKKSKNALLKAIEIEKKNGTNEFISLCNGTLNVVASFFSNETVNAFNAEKYEDAIKYAEEAIESAKAANYKEALEQSKYVMALSYEVLKNTDKANELYRELIKENTKKPDVYIKIFAANQAAKETDKAINVLKRGVKNLPENAQLKALLGSTYLANGNKEEAEKIIQSLLALGEKKEVFNYVGDIYRDASDITKAEEYYNKSLALEPAQTDAYFGLASTYFNKAVDVLKEADKVPLDDMTGAYDKLKNEAFDLFKKAIPNYTKVLETKPKDFQSLKALRTIYSLLGMKAEYQDIDNRLKQQ